MLLNYQKGDVINYLDGDSISSVTYGYGISSLLLACYKCIFNTWSVKPAGNRGKLIAAPSLINSIFAIIIIYDNCTIEKLLQVSQIIFNNLYPVADRVVKDWIEYSLDL